MVFCAFRLLENFYFCNSSLSVYLSSTKISEHSSTSDFDSDPLTFDLVRFSAKNTQNSAKNNRICPGKARGGRALIVRYLDSPMAKVFLWDHPLSTYAKFSERTCAY